MSRNFLDDEAFLFYLHTFMPCLEGNTYIVQTESICSLWTQKQKRKKKEPSFMRVSRPGKGNIADMVIFITIGYNNLNKQFILFLTGPILYCIVISYHDVF